MTFSLSSLRQALSFAFSLLSLRHPATARTTAVRRSSIRLPKCSPTIADSLNCSPPISDPVRLPTISTDDRYSSAISFIRLPNFPIADRNSLPPSAIYDPCFYHCAQSTIADRNSSSSDLYHQRSKFLISERRPQPLFLPSAHRQYSTRFFIADCNPRRLSISATSPTIGAARSAPISNLRLPISAHPFAFYRTIRHLPISAGRISNISANRNYSTNEATKGAFMCYICVNPYRTFDSAGQLKTHYKIDHSDIVSKGGDYCTCGAFFPNEIEKAKHGCVLREVEQLDTDVLMHIFKDRMLHDMKIHKCQKFRCPKGCYPKYFDTPMEVHNHVMECHGGGDTD